MISSPNKWRRKTPLRKTPFRPSRSGRGEYEIWHMCLVDSQNNFKSNTMYPDTPWVLRRRNWSRVHYDYVRDLIWFSSLLDLKSHSTTSGSFCRTEDQTNSYRGEGLSSCFQDGQRSPLSSFITLTEVFDVWSLVRATKYECGEGIYSDLSRGGPVRDGRIFTVVCGDVPTTVRDLH